MVARYFFALYAYSPAILFNLFAADAVIIIMQR